MTTLFERAAGLLATATQAAAGGSVSYQQGVGAPISLVGTRSAVDEQVVDAEGVYVATRQHSFCFVYASLGITPRAGDTITETVAGSVKTWMAMDRADGKCWAWEDAASVLIRVWVQEIGT